MIVVSTAYTNKEGYSASVLQCIKNKQITTTTRNPTHPILQFHLKQLEQTRCNVFNCLSTINHYFVLKNKDRGRVVVINWELHNLNLMSWAAILKFRCHCLPGTKLVNKGEKDSTGTETERKKLQERDRAS